MDAASDAAPAISLVRIDPPLGTVLKQRFELEAVIGAGGMGVIYRAIDRRRAEAGDPAPHVAIKVLAPALRGDQAAIYFLLRESLKAQALRHPHILRVLDQDRDGALPFVVMEYVEGAALSQIIASHRDSGLPRSAALRILRELADALAFIHGHGVVHADLKPANALLARAGIVKLLDFGLAGAFIGDLAAELDPAFSVAEAFGGVTPAYASAERLEGAELDPSDDVYALALIGYELLTGRHPYERQSGIEVRDRSLTPAPVSGLRPRQWRALCDALAPTRARHTATVALFLRQFDGRPAWVWRSWDTLCDGLRALPRAIKARTLHRRSGMARP